MKLPALHHLQVLVIGLGLGICVGIGLGLWLKGVGEAFVVILITFGLCWVGGMVLWAIEGERESRQRLRDLDAKHEAERRQLLWRVHSPASSKSSTRWRRGG
jgi:hypothetical protein